MNNHRIRFTGGGDFIRVIFTNSLSEDDGVSVADDGNVGTASILQAWTEYHLQSVSDSFIPTKADIGSHLAGLSSYAIHKENPAHGIRIYVQYFSIQLNTQSKMVARRWCFPLPCRFIENVPNTLLVICRQFLMQNMNSRNLPRERHAEFLSNHYDVSMVGMCLFSVCQGNGGARTHSGEYSNLIAQFCDDLVHGLYLFSTLMGFKHTYQSILRMSFQD